MSASKTLAPRDLITVDDIHNAMNLVVFEDPERIEGPMPVCDWPKLCGSSCRFPRYHRHGEPFGLVGEILVQLGYPVSLLKNMDMEYELGEVLHPGVKIARCRNQALRRIDRRGIGLLTFLQDHQQCGRTWSWISVQAFRPRHMVPFLDVRRRPWLY
jgi:hypothetical protein